MKKKNIVEFSVIKIKAVKLQISINFDYSVFLFVYSIVENEYSNIKSRAQAKLIYRLY